MTALALGIDLGTSGVRSAVVTHDGAVVAQARGDYGPDPGHNAAPECWWQAVCGCIRQQCETLKEAGYDPARIDRIGVDGTSGSMVLVDADLRPVTRALMYSDGGLQAEAARIAGAAPPDHITRGPNSSLARMLALQAEPGAAKARHLLHQADFIIARLRGRGGVSDDNNALKLGFDPQTRTWPDWFQGLGIRMDLVPTVRPAGARLGPMDRGTAKALGLPEGAQVHAGTTDSLAAFLAGADLKTGAAVTSLGTTLAVKIVSDTRIDAPGMGLYAHRLGGRWLVGGASNTGGGVLRTLFPPERLATLSARIDPERESPLDYYPLARPGERFPVNDPALAPRLEPRPDDDVAYLAGLLESIARIEARCYALIAERGGPKPDHVRTVGGGAQNPQWTAIRRRVLGCPVTTAETAEAAVGAARLTLLPEA